MLYFKYKEYQQDIMDGFDNQVIDITNLITEDTYETDLPSSANLTLLVKVADSLGSFANFTTFITVTPMVYLQLSDIILKPVALFESTIDLIS